MNSETYAPLPTLLPSRHTYNPITDYVLKCKPNSVTEDTLSCGGAHCEQNRAIHHECPPPFAETCTNHPYQTLTQTEPRLGLTDDRPDIGIGVTFLSSSTKPTLQPGDVLGAYLGELITTKELARRLRRRGPTAPHYEMQLSDDRYVDGTRHANLLRYVNHSCDSNAKFESWVVNNQSYILLKAHKHIADREEITADYYTGAPPTIVTPCLCRAEQE